MLLKRSNLFITLGGCPAAVHREWTRLNRAVAGDETLRALTPSELFSRLFIHFVDEHSNVLLLAAVWHAAAMDVRLRLATSASLVQSLRFDDRDHRRDMLLFIVSRAWQAIGEEMDTSTMCEKSIVESWRNKVARSVARG